MTIGVERVASSGRAQRTFSPSGLQWSIRPVSREMPFCSGPRQACQSKGSASPRTGTGTKASKPQTLDKINEVQFHRMANSRWDRITGSGGQVVFLRIRQALRLGKALPSYQIARLLATRPAGGRLDPRWAVFDRQSLTTLRAWKSFRV